MAKAKRIRGGVKSRQTDGQRLAARIRAAILRGDHTVGEMLGYENQLLETYGVSRPTIREAFRVLEAETLIHVERGSRGGIRVRRPDRSIVSGYAALVLQNRSVPLSDVFECRLMIEPSAIRLLAEQQGPDAGAELMTFLEKVEVEPHPRKRAVEAGRFLTRALELFGNQTLVFIGEILDDILRSAIEKGLDRARDEDDQHSVVDRAIRSLRVVAHYVAEGRGEAAARSVEAHLKGAAQTLESALGHGALVESLGSTRPWQTPKRAELIAEHFRRQIASGSLREGDELPPVAEIQKELSISRPSLVEGLRILESQGLISTRLGAAGGAVVHAPSVEQAAHYASLVLGFENEMTMSDLMGAEAILEPPATRMLAERGTPEDVETLRTAFRQISRSDDPVRDRTAFRRLLLKLSKNRTLGLFADLVGRLIYSEMQALDTLDLSTERGDRVLENLIGLIELKAGPTAESLWREHLLELRSVAMSRGLGSRPLRYLGGL